jgi:oxygen-dependent protoporphyrinogen oxidase
VEAAVAAWPAVTVTGASYRGVGLPDCISQGQAAAASVAARLGAEVRPVDVDPPVRRAVALA